MLRSRQRAACGAGFDRRSRRNSALARTATHVCCCQLSCGHVFGVCHASVRAKVCGTA